MFLSELSLFSVCEDKDRKHQVVSLEHHLIPRSEPYQNIECQNIINFVLCESMLICFSHIRLCNPMAITCQAPLSMGFSREGYRSRLPYPPPGDLPEPGIDPTHISRGSCIADRFFTPELPGKPLFLLSHVLSTLISGLFSNLDEQLSFIYFIKVHIYIGINRFHIDIYEWYRDKIHIHPYTYMHTHRVSHIRMNFNTKFMSRAI